MKYPGFLRANKAILKRLHHYFEYQIIKKDHSKFRTRKFVKDLGCKQLSKAQIKEIKDYYASFGFKNINTEWHRFFTHVSGKFYKEYIPVEFFHNVIEPNLNETKMDPALKDKNLLSKIFTGVKQPKSIIKNINGYFYDGDTHNLLELPDVLKKCKKHSKLIIKPSLDSGGGKNIIVFKIENNITNYKKLSIEEILNLYDKNYIIQIFFKQHEQMEKLNPSSVNTLRIQSLFINNKIEILASIVRIGGKNSDVDNLSRGGCYCNISSEGVLNKQGYHSNAHAVLETDTKVKFDGFEIPNYINILKDVKNLHVQMPYFKIIAWDIAINEDGEGVLIEHNPFMQIIFHQYAVGPLFGKFTDEILDQCEIRMFSR